MCLFILPSWRALRACSHLDLWPSCRNAKCCRRSAIWAVQLKNGGRPRCCTARSSKKKGELLASLVSMALICDLRSRPFRWAFYEVSLSSAVLVSPEARIRCSLPNLAHVVRGSMGQTGICGHGLCESQMNVNKEMMPWMLLLCLLCSVCADVWAGHGTPAAALSTYISGSVAQMIDRCWLVALCSSDF